MEGDIFGGYHHLNRLAYYTSTIKAHSYILFGCHFRGYSFTLTVSLTYMHLVALLGALPPIVLLSRRII